MKQIYLLLATLLLVHVQVFGQSVTSGVPNKFNYQSVVRDTIGQLVTNQPVGMRLSLQRGPQMTNLYTETHQLTTNSNGLLTTTIGSGQPTLGMMDTIDWSGGMVYVKTEIDMTGGSNYSLVSTRELLSVPYALYSLNSGSNSLLVPQVATDSFEIVGNEVRLFGSLHNLNGGFELAKGFCIDTLANVGIDKTKNVAHTGLGSYEFRNQGLLPGFTYYFRAFAVTTAGIGYGALMQFQTPAAGTPSFPVLVTRDAQNVNHQSAVLLGEVISDGNLPLQSRGFCYSNSPNPSLSNNTVIMGSSVGVYSTILNGLTNSDTFYYKAYATNSLGTSYGDEKLFITTTPSNLFIGQSFQGGTIFHIDSGGRSGLIASEGICCHPWGCTGQFIPGLLRVVGSGQHNTNSILSACGMTNIAARACQDLIVNGYDDWYMGSNSEITLLNTSLTRGVGNQSPGSLTSSQYSSTEHIGRNFNGGNHPGSKNDAWHIRAIRSFSLDSNTSTPIVDSLRSMRISYFAADLKFNLLSNGNLTTGIGLCYAAHPNPTIFDSTEYVESTLYGEKVLTAIDLNPNTVYYARGYAINKIGITYTQILQFRTKAIDTIVQDIDGNNYRVINVGNQQWFIDELRAKRFTNGDSIPRVIPNSAWSAMNQPSYSILDNNSLNEAKFGLLYNGYTVTGQRRICPTGWRTPNSTDYSDLISHMQFSGLSSTRHNLMRRQTWYPWTGTWPEPFLSNRLGWNAQSSGRRNTDGSFDSGGGYSMYWVNSTGLTNPEFRHLNHAPDFISNFGGHGTYIIEGNSIRCVRNFGSVIGQLPTIQTELPTSVFATGAVLGGNVVSDGGSSVIDRGICIDTLPNPSVSGNFILVGSGVGTFTSTIAGLNPNRNYFVRAFATNLIGTAYGQQYQFITPNPVSVAQPCNPPTVTDIDGNVYNTVQIGTQCWMKENLRVTRFKDSTVIPDVPLFSAWSNLSVNGTWPWMGGAAYCNYFNNSANDHRYGKLYNGNVLYDSFNMINNSYVVDRICPTGWKMPSLEDYQDLMYYSSIVNSNTAGALLDTITGFGNNVTGWSGRLGGLRWSSGSYEGLDVYARYLSKTTDHMFNPYALLFNYYFSPGPRACEIGIVGRFEGNYIRCIKN